MADKTRRNAFECENGGERPFLSSSSDEASSAEAGLGKGIVRRALIFAGIAFGVGAKPFAALAAVAGQAPPLFGAYNGYAEKLNDGSRAYLHTEAMIGKPIDMVVAFGDQSAYGGWGDGTGIPPAGTGTMESSAAYNLSQLAGCGKKLLWSQPLAMGYGSYNVFGYGTDTAHPPSGLNDVAAGNFDKTFAFIANQLIANGFPDAIVRIGWEFNLQQFPWGNPYGDQQVHATAYVAAFRHVVQVMRAVAGNQFKFHWCPNKGKPDLPTTDVRLAYPGDDVVDFIGMDVYDDDLDYQNPQGYGTNAGETPAQRWETSCVGAVGDQRLLFLANFSTKPTMRPMVSGVAPKGRKPIVIGEWGAGGPCSIQDAPGRPYAQARAYAGGDDGYYVGHMLAWFKNNGVYAHGLYDIFDSGINYSGAISYDPGVTGVSQAGYMSNTPNAIGTGPLTYQVAAGLPIKVGTPLIIIDNAASTANFLEATVTSYTGTSLGVNVFAAKGSGTPITVTLKTHPNALMPKSLAAVHAHET